MIDHFAAPWEALSRYELRSDARRFENWENAYALRAGLGAAVRYALDIGIEAIHERAWKLADQLRNGLRHMKGIALHDAGHTQCAIVSFAMENTEPEAVVAYLRKRGMAIGTSARNSTLLDAENRSLPTMLRAALL